MERQTILERLGWRFIRIRGSEFFRDSEKTIGRVITELTSYGIEPEDSASEKYPERETELLKRVKARAYSILAGENPVPPEQDTETIAAALNPEAIVPDSEAPKELKISIDNAEKTQVISKKAPESTDRHAGTVLLC